MKNYVVTNFPTPTKLKEKPILMMISVAKIDPHPDNPRIGERAEIVSAIAEQLRAAGYFEDCHAIVVRKVGKRYQVIEGHTRRTSAILANLDVIPCWVYEAMSDEDAHARLALGNAQGELTYLEIALVALNIDPAPGKKGMGRAAFAKRMGLKDSNLARYCNGAKVFVYVRSAGTSDKIIEGCRERCEALARISKAPEESWLFLVQAMVANKWSAEEAEAQVAKLAEPPTKATNASPLTMRAETDPTFAEVLKSFLNPKDSLGGIGDSKPFPPGMVSKYPELTFKTFGDLRKALSEINWGATRQGPKVRKVTPSVAATAPLPPVSNPPDAQTSAAADCPFTALFNLGFLGKEEHELALAYQHRNTTKAAPALDFAKFLIGAIEEKQFKASDVLKADSSDTIMWLLVTGAPRRAIDAATKRLGTDPTDLTSVLTAVSAKPIAEHAELIPDVVSVLLKMYRKKAA